MIDNISSEKLITDFYTSEEYAENCGPFIHLLTPSMKAAKAKANKAMHERINWKNSMTREQYLMWWHSADGCCSCHDDNGNPIIKPIIED
jgi:hypothetical protein